MGDPSPPASYTEQDHATWRVVYQQLSHAHRAHACREVLKAREQAPIPSDHIPQHEELGSRLRRLTGFDFTLAGGFVANKRFLGSMARGYFHAVQFVRHPALPLYTPEPDVIHDLLAHGIHLSSTEFADLYRLFGRTAMRVDTKEALETISHVYWFTLECGVISEGDIPKAYGAALLSSYGELSRLPQCQIRGLDIPAMLNTRYEFSGYQRTLFIARCMNHLTDTLAAFLEAFDDDTAPRLGLPVPAP